jgi:hypothetical protein
MTVPYMYSNRRREGTLMDRISRNVAALLKGGLAVACLAMVTFWPGWRAELRAEDYICQEQAERAYADSMQNVINEFTDCWGSILDDTACEYFEPFGCEWCTGNFNEDSNDAAIQYAWDLSAC